MCRTCTEAAAQARAALRRRRDALRQPADAGAAAAAPAASSSSAQQDHQDQQPQQQQAASLPRRLTVRLPLPSPGRGDDALHNYDQARAGSFLWQPPPEARLWRPCHVRTNNSPQHHCLPHPALCFLAAGAMFQPCSSNLPNVFNICTPRCPQADWPGGIQQRFRRLRPLIEEQLLAGYDPQVRRCLVLGGSGWLS